MSEIWTVTPAGLVAGAAAGSLAAPDMIALPGLALGLLVGLTIAWRRASAPAGAPQPAVDRQLADDPVRRPLAAPRGDHAPGC